MPQIETERDRSRCFEEAVGTRLEAVARTGGFDLRVHLGAAQSTLEMPAAHSN